MTAYDLSSGSSPLSRGIQGRKAFAGTLTRIIPALAGNTISRDLFLTVLWDHPRSRGEYLGKGLYEVGSVGSSPLSRGIPRPLLSLMSFCRIIPALAGNTTGLLPLHIHPTDHPRSRGEYQPELVTDEEIDGSSPLSRGIQHVGSAAGSAGGIIPALAGNTGPLQPFSSVRPDHPRSRGEYVTQAAGAPPRGGSSPLSRGIPSSADMMLAAIRIIPALAGNTSKPGSALWNQPDHPRSRGEYCFSSQAVTSDFGSSPLSRGIPVRVDGASPEEGIIPALAGNTTLSRYEGEAESDHPRSRGEYR